ncbi:MAG: hypothetical protein HGA49_09660 [Eubacteriaceae bacterium]|nr:hypothetical protein [Eubacteriaceae bacterium]
MKIKMPMMAIIVFTIFFGGIAATMAADIWSSTSTKTPVKYQDGENAGEYNPEDIRGSYTFNEVAALFEIDLKVLYKAFGLDENTDGNQMQIKELENLYSNADPAIGTESIQLFVALYKNLPISLNEAYLPKQGAALLLEENKNLTEEQKDYLETHQVELEEINPSLPINNEDEATNEEALVKGSTTFQQLLDARITKAEIEGILGQDMPPSNLTIKDFCIDKGLSFSTVKDQLNQLAE